MSPGNDLNVFFEELRDTGYSGDIDASAATRQTSATDNSIYELVPEAVLFPRCGEDLARIVNAARQTGTVLTMRGGGTGTNGQSLNTGVTIDTARHMTKILRFDPATSLVEVEPGVVLEQLNAFLADHGLHFPINISTASRATIGGMIATDAAGKGSRVCGRTSDHVASLAVVLCDGSEWTARKMSLADAGTIAAGTGLIAAIHRELLEIGTRSRDLVRSVFPQTHRSLTGYNLMGLMRGGFNLVPLLAGSEGTLAITKSAVLRASRKDALRALIVATYADFGAALDDVPHLLQGDPSAIETIDDRILAAAQRDVIWNDIKEAFADTAIGQVGGLHFIELTAAHEDELAEKIARYRALFAGTSAAWNVIRDPSLISRLWKMREKSVGLLAQPGGTTQGMPFVEDTAVPPEALPAYVKQFRAVLDRHGLQYGMFGHADVGCLHVRPMLNMRLPEHAALVRTISDEVAALVKGHGGVFWGEHGRGFRGEYAPLFFGPALYAELARIKRVFDPRNMFNPGKLASPDTARPVAKLDDIPFRGPLDHAISPELSAAFGDAVSCNGNGICHTWDAADVICPSYKATRDRSQSPQGRAILLRRWMRAQSSGPAKERRLAERDALRALDTCLSCKACARQCPVQVDVPAMKSRFLSRYYARRLRPLRHWLVRVMETALPAGRAFPNLANRAMRNPLGRSVLKTVFGLVDLPPFAPALQKHLAPQAGKSEKPAVVIVEDNFTSSFDGRTVDAAKSLLALLGYPVRTLPPRPNGKALYVLGFKRAFAKLARTRAAEALAQAGAVLIGLDAATALMHQNEYREFQSGPGANVMGIEQFLAGEIQAGRLADRQGLGPTGPLRIFLHCTEKTQRPMAGAHWKAVFAHFGLQADIAAAGCCGMAGLFGHEADHAALSRDIFEMSWRPALPADRDAALATGFSCRCQTKRFAGFRPGHPAEYLLDHLQKAAADAPNV